MSAVGKTYLLLIIWLSIQLYGEASPKSICVIGAGRAGLAVIKSVADQIGKFKPIAFERNSDVGGLWIYTDKTDVDKHGLPVHSSVYKNLKTITPKEQMTYPDYPTLHTDGFSPYVSHETFLQYMRNYTDHFALRRYIKFDTLVTKVTPLKDRCKPDSALRWMIENRNLDSNTDDAIVCDGLIVCNGRFSKPNIPRLAGIDKFPGRVLHSHDYRKPEDLLDKRVIVWGNGASALGIAKDLNDYAKSVFLSYKDGRSQDPRKVPSNVHIVKGVVAVDGSDFILEDNSRITADAFIFSTGYVYDFPFLDENSGIAPDKHRLFPLAKKFINKQHPSMAFIGLGDHDIYAREFYAESKYFLSTLKGKED